VKKEGGVGDKKRLKHTEGQTGLIVFIGKRGGGKRNLIWGAKKGKKKQKSAFK